MPVVFLDRWTTLAMLAMAFLAVTTAAENAHRPATVGLIELTLNELRRPFDALTAVAATTLEPSLARSGKSFRRPATAGPRFGSPSTHHGAGEAR